MCHLERQGESGYHTTTVLHHFGEKMELLKAMEEGRVTDLADDLIKGRNKFLNRVYDWVALGLTLTAAVAYMIAATPGAMSWLEHHRGMVFLLLLLEFGLAQYISWSGVKESITGTTATGLYCVYCAANGVTLAPLLHIYTAASVHAAFFTTAGIFVTMSVYGHVTKRDLTEPRNLAVQLVWGLLLAMIVNVFLGLHLLDFLISCACVVVFTGLVAFDTQMLKQMAQGRSGDATSALPIVGALLLYLDFLNLFIHILRLFGARKD